jgi:hypothetical protein
MNNTNMSRRTMIAASAAAFVAPSLPTPAIAKSSGVISIAVSACAPATDDAAFEALEWTPVRTSRSVPIQGIRQ